MAAEIFTALSNLRMILDTETDADSPVTEVLKDALRYAIECILILMFGTGVSGDATSDPSATLTDGTKSWSSDQHNGRTLLITSGAGKGNFYTIDATAATSVTCTGDDLYADGVRSGDSYIILYDIKVNADGHDHDGVNAALPVLANNQVTNAKLKTVATSVSGTNAGTVDIATQDFCFMPNIYQEYTGDPPYLYARPTNTADYVGRFVLGGGASSSAYVVRFRYITASDEPFIYVARERATGKILHCWMGDDPPPGYWGLSETPENFERPVVGFTKDKKPQFDPETHEEIISWKVKKDLWQAIKDRQKANRKKAPHRVMEDEFEYDAIAQIWKSKNLLAA